MNEIIALLFPASFGTYIYSKQTEEKSTIEIMFIYLINIIITNFICYFISYHLYKTKIFEFTNPFTLKYLLFASIISTLTGIIMTLISKSLNLKIEVKKNEKRSIKTKKSAKSNK